MIRIVIITIITIIIVIITIIIIISLDIQIKHWGFVYITKM